MPGARNILFFLPAFLLFLTPTTVSAQNEAAVWLTGNGQQLNFQSGQPVLTEFEGKYNAIASICDKDGNLLFYTDGKQLWNRKHELMMNGESLHANNHLFLNRPEFIPWPGKNGHYLLIYESVYIPSGTGTYKYKDKKILYAVIDANANNGSGKVISKGNKIHVDYHSSPTIAGYCNDSYFWLIIDANENVTDYRRDGIYAYKIDENGVNYIPVINRENNFGNSNNYKFSPNGDKIRFTLANNDYEREDLIADFNFKTGELYNFRYIGFQIFTEGEFSPNSNLFYCFDGMNIIQFDARYVNLNSSSRTYEIIHTFSTNDENMYPGNDLQLGPDGKIYFTWLDVSDGKTKLGRINNPNNIGSGCDVDPEFFITDNFFWFPDFVTSFFRDKQPEYIDEVPALAGKNIEVCPNTSLIIGENTEHDAFYHWFPEQKISDPLIAQPEFTSPPRYGEPEDAVFTLRATDGNCWVNFDQLTITQLPFPAKLHVEGSWSVCPFVEEVDYWSEDKGNEIHWLVDGGEIADGNGTSSIKVNWMETNPDASVKVFSINKYQCNSDTTKFAVRINVELITETPKGPEELCIADRNNLIYKIRRTNGSVYDWNARGGEIVSGQGTNQVVVNWLTDGMHSLVVNETSTTIDTICFGESEPLWVEVINDSLEIELENVSFNLDNNVDVIYRSEKLNQDIHQITILTGEEGSTVQKEVGAPGSYDGSTVYFSDTGNLIPETIRLKVMNACNELFISNPLETIVLKAQPVIGQQVRLIWNPNRFWQNNRVTYQVWQSESEKTGWKLLAENVSEGFYDFTNTGMALTHFFRVKAVNADKNIESWSNRIRIELEDDLEIPDVFTPNGDGYNDVWNITNIRFYEMKRATVFNRYGQKMYECVNEFIPWDGQYNGTVTQGTYLYELEFNDGTVRNGQLTLLK